LRAAAHPEHALEELPQQVGPLLEQIEQVLPIDAQRDSRLRYRSSARHIADAVRRAVKSGR
jgi:hypothetical protein